MKKIACFSLSSLCRSSPCCCLSSSRAFADSAFALLGRISSLSETSTLTNCQWQYPSQSNNNFHTRENVSNLALALTFTAYMWNIFSAGKEAKTGLLGCVLYRSYGSSVPRRAIGYYHDSSTCWRAVPQHGVTETGRRPAKTTAGRQSAQRNVPFWGQICSVVLRPNMQCFFGWNLFLGLPSKSFGTIMTAHKI